MAPGGSAAQGSQGTITPCTGPHGEESGGFVIAEIVIHVL